MTEIGEGILYISKESLELDTGLSNREATTGRVFQNLRENGLIIKSKDGEIIGFDNYTFETNYLNFPVGRKSESVFVKGPGFSGIPLYNLFSQDKKKAIQGINLLSLAVEYAKQNEISIPNIGPLGMIIGTDENEGQILILPPTIFEKSLSSRGDTEASRYSGIFKKPSLQEIDSWRFTLSVYAYRIITDKNPFENLDTSERVLDYLDFNFIPLEALVSLKAVDGTDIDTHHLLSVITNNLRIISPEALKKSKRSEFAKYKTIPLPVIPSDFSVEFLPYQTNPDYAKLKKKIDKTRFFRKNSFTFKILAGVLACVFIFVASIILDYSGRKTTFGLSPEAVIEMMYSGFNKLDIDVFEATLLNKSAGKSMGNLISTLNVQNKFREAYENDKATFTMDQWVNLKTPLTSYFFGITDLTLTLLEDGDNQKKYLAEYYLLTNNPDLMITGFKENDILTLVYKRGCWKVSNMESSQSDLEVDTAEFYKDVEEVCNAIPDSQRFMQGVILCSELKPKYDWMPSVEAADIGYFELLERYGLINLESK